MGFKLKHKMKYIEIRLILCVVSVDGSRMYVLL